MSLLPAHWPGLPSLYSRFGLVWRFIWYARGLNWQADRVAYAEHIGYGVKGALKSIVAWLIPFGTHSWRFYPIFTVLVFIFHIGLLVTPLFLLGHNLLLQERWGISLPAIPEALADTLTVAMMVAGVLHSAAPYRPAPGAHPDQTLRFACPGYCHGALFNRIPGPSCRWGTTISG